MIKGSKLKVLLVRELTIDTYILRIERSGLIFNSGQHFTIGLSEHESREYSVYSGENDDYLEFLIREVQDGFVSKKLRKLSVDDTVFITGPYGHFTLNEANINLNGNKLYLIASGTGIAPFHSFVKSFKSLDYTLIHGVRTAEEAYDHIHYDSSRIVCCLSREKKIGFFSGYITEFLKAKNMNLIPESFFFICGNYNMIHDAYDILKDLGISSSKIFIEGYF